MLTKRTDFSFQSKRKNKHGNAEDDKNIKLQEPDEIDVFSFFPPTRSNRRKTQYVRFEDKSTDSSSVAKPRIQNTGNILNGATEALINVTQDILLNNKYPSSFVFLSNLLSNSAAPNTRLTGNRQKITMDEFLDSVDEYDHRSRYSEKVRH